MSHDLIQKVFKVSDFVTPTGANGPTDFNAATDKFLLTPMAPVDIYRFGFIMNSTAATPTGNFDIIIDKRPTAGSDTARTTISTLRRTNAQGSIVPGTLYFHDIVVPVAATVVPVGAPGFSGQQYNTRVGGGPLHIRPGEEAVIKVNSAFGAAATGYVFVEYAQKGFVQPSTVAATDGEKVKLDTTISP